MKSFLSMMALALAVAVGVSDAQGATSSRYEVVKIFPTGVFPDDVNNVQAAVDDFGARGVNGTLILKSHNPASHRYGLQLRHGSRSNVARLSRPRRRLHRRRRVSWRGEQIRTDGDCRRQSTD